MSTPQYDNDGRCIGQLHDTVSRDVLNSSPGLQGWSIHKSPVIIFSAHRASDTDRDNERAHDYTLSVLRENKVPHKSARGAYKGVPEACIIVRCDDERHARIARIMAGARGQESILCLTGDRVATLETPMGEMISDLGTLRAVPRVEAERSDAYTFTNDTYYVCK